MKTCIRCLETKSLDQFYPAKTSRDKLQSTCKKCDLQKTAERQKANPEACRAKTKRWQIKNFALIKQKRKLIKDSLMCAKYQITQEYRNQLLEKQSGLCAICRVVAHTSRKPLHIDHDHVTGKVRGLLCHSCNVGIGFLKENTEILENAKQYLSKHFNQSPGL